MSGASTPAFAQVVRVELGGAGSHMPAGGVLSANPAAINPALGGVSSFQGTLSPSLNTPAALSAAMTPAAAVPSAIPAAAVPAAQAPTALQSVNAAAAAIGDMNGKNVAPAQAREAAAKAFDGSASAAAASDEPGSDATPAEAPLDSHGQALSKLYPRVVFIQDVFSGPAAETTVAYVNKLVDAGAHVVFLTWRPQKGVNSADEVLLSRVKQSRNNPVVVVSYNGGKISLHGRAANPKAIIENVGAFPEAALAKIKSIAGGVEINAAPTEAEAFSVNIPLDLAKQTDKQAIAALNRKLKAAGFDYVAEAHPSIPNTAIIHSMPLRFSLPRVMQALKAQFTGEDLSEEKFLILADSVKSPKFSQAFPRNSEVQVVKNGDQVENVIGAVLGERTLDSVSLKLGKLRQYVEYWEPSHRRAMQNEEMGGGSSGGFGGGGVRRGAGDRETNKNFAMYVGTIMYGLMAELYDDVFRGQHQKAKLTVLQARLRDMWYNPLKHGVYVNKGLAKAMRSPAWKAMSRGYLEYANSYLTNFYFREFGDYSRAAKNVQENYVGLSTDRKSLITLDFKSSATNRLYKIHTRIPRVMRYETASGLNLTAYAYRTGKETPDDGEVFLARVLAFAMLKGHGRKGADGKWHHGSPDGKVIESLHVQLEYRTSARVHIFKTEEFIGLEENTEINGPIVQEILSAIEREEADAEYQEYYKEQEQQATKEDMKKPRKKPAAKGAKAAPKTKKGGK